MKTEDLIDLLAKDAPQVERPRWRARLAMILVGGFLIGAALVWWSIGFRDDMRTNPAPLLVKTTFSALFAAAALPLAIRLLQPGSPLGWRLAALLVLVGICAVATTMALMGTPIAQWYYVWCRNGLPKCLMYIPMFSAPTAIGLVWLSRGLAPTRLTLTGAAIGALSGGVGAVAYSLHCPIDSVAYVTTWYTLAIASCAAIGALVGQRVLRW